MAKRVASLRARPVIDVKKQQWARPLQPVRCALIPQFGWFFLRQASCPHNVFRPAVCVGEEALDRPLGPAFD
jgi:hypothetical protein